jgi:hypothetical protein
MNNTFKYNYDKIIEEERKAQEALDAAKKER